MRGRFTAAVMAGTAAVLIALPAAAAARTHLVWAGGLPKFQKTLGNKFGAEALDFFPHKVTVAVGDTIEWQGMSIGFHTIDIPSKGGKALPLITPTGTTASALDAAGNPFWFSGKLPNVGFNPALFAASGGKVFSGSARLDSGLPLGKPTPYKVTFTKPGTYAYFCDVHYDMRGIIVVKPKKAKVPSATAEGVAIANQQNRDRKIAAGLAKFKPKKGSVSVGHAGKFAVEILAMFPKTLHVKTGATVTFSMSRLTGETHTATFGPQSYLGPLVNSFGGPTPDARGVYPSDPPPGAIPVSSTSHGNGFANSGAMDENKATPLAPGAKFTFAAPGTYHFMCLIHPFMTGTVVVS